MTPERRDAVERIKNEHGSELTELLTDFADAQDMDEAAAVTGRLYAWVALYRAEVADAEFEKGYEQAVRAVLIDLRAWALLEAHKLVYDKYARALAARSEEGG